MRAVMKESLTCLLLALAILSCIVWRTVAASAKDCRDDNIKDDLDWLDTPLGGTANISCPVGIGEAYRQCSEDGVWQQIDYTNCMLRSLETLRQQMNNASALINELIDIADDLVYITSHNITLSGHVITAVELVENLMVEPVIDPSYADFDQIETLVQNIIFTSGNLLNVKHIDLWENIHEDKSVCRLFVKNIEFFGDDITSYLSKAGQESIEIQASDNLKATYIVTSGNVNLKRQMSLQEAAVEITIPKSVFVNKDAQYNAGVAILVFGEGFADLLPTHVITPRRTPIANVHSHVMSCSFFPLQPELLVDKPLSIEFTLNEHRTNNTCSVIDTNSSSSIWQQNGMSTSFVNATHANCFTSRLTGTLFAVAEVKIYRTQLPAVVTTALVFALVLFFATFVILLFSNRRLESDRATLVLFFLITLTAGHLTFVTGLYATDNLVACKVVSLVLHFSQLSYSFWMLGQIVQLMLKVTYKTTETGSVAQYCALGWITPSFVVASSAGLQWDYYGIERFCTIPLDQEISPAFIIPVILIAFTNFICLLCAARGFYKIKKKERKLMHRMRRIMPNIRACLVIHPLLVLTWSVGAISIHQELTGLDVLWALMIIAFSVCVFLFYGVFSSEVQNEYELRYGPCCGRKRSAVQDSPRPGWRDEISQMSQMREPSSIARDADSTTTNGTVPGTSGLQVPDYDDMGPWHGEHTGDSTGSLSSAVASSLALKSKLKVFPLRKAHEQSPRRTVHETLT